MTDVEKNKSEIDVSCVLFLDLMVKGLRVPAQVQQQVLETLNSHLQSLGIRYTIRLDHVVEWNIRPDTASLLLHGEIKCNVSGRIKCSKCFSGRLPLTRTKVSLTMNVDGGLVTVTGKLVAGPVNDLSNIYDL